jgi:hypothetical protein
MKTTAILVGAVLAAGAAGTVNFDQAEVGKPPSDWTATQTGTGQAKWAIVQDDTAPSKPNVLKQSGQATYPVCLKDDTSLKDGFVEVKFKALSGKEDQAGGVVWRAKDANNYYVARANALENNVTIYHTINGRRTEKKRANMKVPSNQWHTFRVDFQGETEAVAFANDFGGRVMPIESAKSQGIAEAQHRSEANKGDRWEDLEFGFSKLRVV